MGETKKEKSKRKKVRPDGFEYVADTAGKILNGVFVNCDKQELKIEFATGRILHYRPVEDVN
jgi:hypothetical protein